MASAPNTLTRVVELLVKLYREGDHWLRSLHPNEWRRRDLNRVFTECRVSQFTSADEVQVMLGLYAQRKANRPQKALVIKPWIKTGDDVLLLLEPVFDKGADGVADKTTFYLGVVTYLDNARRGFFGYRYEGPEGGQTHNFYHAQPIRGFDKGNPIQYSIKWYPDKWPTFPLNVADDCQLLLALMLSVQGMDKLQSEADQPRSGIREHAKDLILRISP